MTFQGDGSTTSSTSATTRSIAVSVLLLGYKRDTFKRETAISATAPERLDKSGLTFRARIEPRLCD